MQKICLLNPFGTLTDTQLQLCLMLFLQNGRLKRDLSAIISPKLLGVYFCSPSCCSNANNTSMRRGCKRGNQLRTYEQTTGLPWFFQTTCPHIPCSPFNPPILPQMAVTCGPPLSVELPCLHRLMALTVGFAWQWATIPVGLNLGLPTATATTFTFHGQ